MCRWLAYSGSPVLLERLLYEPKHSLIDQSLHSRLGAETTNGDGFGIGWYGERRAGRLPEHRAGLERPEPPRAGGPRRVAARVRAHPGIHGTPVQQTNCHPFRHGRWLWMHNGVIAPFHDVKRDLGARGRPVAVPDIEGSTDSETFFYLALTLGLEDDPPARRGAGGRLIEAGRSQPRDRAPDPDDGGDDERRDIWGFRYSSEGTSRARSSSTTEVENAAELYPDDPLFQTLLGRDAAGRLGAARRPAGRVERGARVELRRDSGGRGRAARLHARSAFGGSWPDVSW